ncbi:MAG: sulfate ABC transporter ATP-binding protein [Pirellulales bacterium]
MSIEAIRVSKTYGSYQALQDVSLKIEDGELITLLGPSGSGKTTLLRILAGLDIPDAHPETQILFHGENVAGSQVGERRVGFVFQHYALFKHMTVFENIAFGLRVRPRSQRPSREAIHEKVTELLRLIQLEGFGNRYPTQLSGGQRQRVALARALAIQPRVLLLDEPFGALDAKVRQGLRNWLRKLHQELHMTTILVTHDQEEALEVADRVVVMNQAKIEQIGTPEEVFHHPASEFVMDFLGNVNVFHERAQLVSNAPQVQENIRSTRTTAGPRVYVRPHEIEISSQPSDSAWQGKIVRINPAGPMAKIIVFSESNGEIQVDVPQEKYRSLSLSVGDLTYLTAKQARTFSPDYEI